MTSVPKTEYELTSKLAPPPLDPALRLPGAATLTAAGPALPLLALLLVLLELAARELPADLHHLKAQTAHGVVDALLPRDLRDGGGGEGLEPLHHHAVGALLRVVRVAVLRVEVEARPPGLTLLRRGGGLRDGHVRTQPVQGLQDLVLGLTHAGRHGVDHDDERDSESEPGGDDERRLSAPAQLTPEIGEEHRSLAGDGPDLGH
ncbi:hypothetical protein GCM10010431_47810 [Streptomyces kunmingensis]